MILWINGAFGAGKTTLAEELRRRLPDALTVDPEEIGLVLRRSVPAPGTADFQDIPLWRRLVAEWLIALHGEYGRTLIVPMTVVAGSYREEIFGAVAAAGIPLRHVFLDVPAGELRRRIALQTLIPGDPEQDDEARAWRSAHVDRCVAARKDLPPGTIVLRGGELTPTELADAVLA